MSDITNANFKSNTNMQEVRMIITDNDIVQPNPNPGEGTSFTINPLDDLQVIRRGKSVSMTHLLESEVVEALKSLLKRDHDHEVMLPPSDTTMSWVEKVLNPEGTPMLEDVASRLTTLFKSEQFNHNNFPEIPERHIRRLRWVAKNRGFKTVQEVLTVVHRASELKGTEEQIWTRLEELSARPKPVPAHVMSVVLPLAKKLGKDLAKQTKKLGKAVQKAHRGSLYVNRTVMIWTGERFRFESSFAAPSLMESFVERAYGIQDQPVSFQIINIDPEGYGLPDEVIRKFNEAGVLVIKEKAGVPMIRDTIELKERLHYMENLLGDNGDLNWQFIHAHKDVWTPAAKALFATFDKSIDATYVPSIVTSPIEPESFRKTDVVVTECCDYQGVSLGMDGGGWLPPFYDGKPQASQQIRGLLPMDKQDQAWQCAYAKGMGFVKWDCAVVKFDDGRGYSMGLWTDDARALVCQELEMTDSEFRQAYWDMASQADHKGYPEFRLLGKKQMDYGTKEVHFKLIPVLDVNQIKGKTKDALKSKASQEMVMIKNGYMGALRIEGSFSTMDSCFESLMWMDYDPNEERLEDGTWASPVRRAIEYHQNQLADRLCDEGLSGLASRAASQDEGIEMMLKVLGAFNQVRRSKNPQVKQIEWWMIPTLRSRIWRSLEKAIYQGADGGGISCPQVVFQLSRSIPEGTCVYPLANEGDEVACYRFPMSTHTAMVVTTAQPTENHPELWMDPWGKCEDARMVMNPRDLTFRMQGDDDGDKGGATTDPLIVEMAKNTWEHRLIDIEVQLKGSKAGKYNESMWDLRQVIPMDEQGNVVYNPKPGVTYPNYTSGMELAARSRRGQVGRTTRLQQRLHAMMWQRDHQTGKFIKDPLMGERAIAMAWPNQGEIDIEKKLIQRVQMDRVFAHGLFGRQVEDDFRPGALVQDDDGVWRVNPDMIIKNPGGYDVKQLGSLVSNDYVVGRGCFVYDLTQVVDPEAKFPHGCKKNPGDPIEWCKADKRVDLTSTNWEGARYWHDSKLEIDSIMHWSFRNMEALWNDKIKASFQMPTDTEDFDFGEVLAETISIAKNKPMIKRPQSWFNDSNYELYQQRCGCKDYREAMKDSYRLVAGEETEEQQQEMRSRAALKQQLRLLELPLQDFADLWRLENWRWNQLMNQSEAEASVGNDSEAIKLRKAAEGCINSMVRLINFKESPVAMLLGVSGVEDCTFLPKEELDELVASCYNNRSRRKTFEALDQWVKTNGHRHSLIMNDHGENIHMVNCEICMAKTKQALVNRFRGDTRTVAADWFKDLTSYMNNTGHYKSE